MIYILSDKEVPGAQNLPVISTKFLTPAIPTGKFDAIIFTSKNAVYSIEKLFPEWKKLRVFVVGQECAKEVLAFGVEVFYVCETGYGEDLAGAILEAYSEYSFLYPRAKVVAFDLSGQLLSKSVAITEVVVYETSCSEKPLEAPVSGSVIIFSSPSTVRCFFEKFTWLDTYKAVAIGNTTAKALNGLAEYRIAEHRSLKCAVELAISLEGQEYH